MKVAIVGAGMTGAYLYRLLGKKKVHVEIFDRPPPTTCGISPCAWGASRGFEELVRAAGLKPSDYLLTRSDHIFMDAVRLKADLLTFDKKGLIHDLLEGARVNLARPDPGQYDRIIDATGASRAYLPPIPDDIVLKCVQYRIKTDINMENRIKLGGIGYAWSFPLAPREYHVGCGTLLNDARSVLKGLGWAGNGAGGNERVCACTGAIRLTGPHCSGPFFVRNGGPEVWGVGESIGCVAPLAGDGIVPGMRSVQILLDQWDSPGGYTEAILREFSWMEAERGVMDKLRKSETLAFRDVLVMRKNSRRMGIQVGLQDAAALLRHLR